MLLAGMLILIVSMIGVSVVQESFASESCPVLTGDERYNKYSNIILAKVIKESVMTSELDNNRYQEVPDEKYVLENLQNYKGNLPARFNLTSYVHGDISYELNLGVTYFLNWYGDSESSSLDLDYCGVITIDFDEDLADPIKYTTHYEYVDSYERFISYYETQIKESESLKQQLDNKIDWNNTQCPNTQHVLSERTNGKLACVTPYTMAKLQLDSVDDSFWNVILKNEQQYGVFTHLSKTQNVESVKYDETSIMIHVISKETEKLSVNIHREILESDTKNCPAIPSRVDDIILINGVEVAYEKRLTTDNYRYLEIEINQDQEIPIPTLPEIKFMHKYHDIPYTENSLVIEIISICPV